MRNLLSLVLLLCGSLSLAQMRIIPHITAPGGAFKTEFILANTSGLDETIQFMPFRADGGALEVFSLTLEPNETRFLSMVDLFGEEAVSHFIIGNENKINLTLVYQDAEGANSAAHLADSETQAMRWRVYPGTLNDVLDGLAVVNVDDLEREIHVRQLTQGGVEIKRVTPFSLVPKSKGLYLFEDFEKRDDAYFEVFAEGPLALTALRFSALGEGARFFWQTAAVPLPKLAESQNQAPIISDQVSLSTSAGADLTLSLDHLTVVDPDNAYPDDFTLSVGDGPNYDREGHTITPHAEFAGVLTVPVSVNDGENDSEVYDLQVTVTAPADPRIGQVATLRNNPTYGLSGRAVILDARTIRLENFNYTGGGPDVRVFVGQDESFVNGIIISSQINGQTYQDATLDFPLPEGVTLDDFDSISIWCTIFLISFSEGSFQ